jgi:putative acetyltransferase
VSTVEIRATRPDDPAVAPLLAALDAYLYRQYPVDEFPQDVNHILSTAELLHPSVSFFAAWRGGEALGCAAMLQQADAMLGYGEIKRMFVQPQARGQHLGGLLLASLEGQARALGLRLMKLETGTRQPEAIRLYERCGYRQCALFGGYAPNPVSVFMEKQL